MLLRCVAAAAPLLRNCPFPLVRDFERVRFMPCLARDQLIRALLTGRRDRETGERKASTIVGRARPEEGKKRRAFFFFFLFLSTLLFSSSSSSNTKTQQPNSNPSSKPTSLPTPEAPAAPCTTSTATTLVAALPPLVALPLPTQTAAAPYRARSIGEEEPGARTEAPRGREQPLGRPSSLWPRPQKTGTNLWTGPCVRSCLWLSCRCSRVCLRLSRE